MTFIAPAGSNSFNPYTENDFAAYRAAASRLLGKLRFMTHRGTAHQKALRSLRYWLPGYSAGRLRRAAQSRATRVWVTIADHFEPWWRGADAATAHDRIRHWTQAWPRVADRHADSAGYRPVYTFFYPEEQYEPAALDALARLRADGVADVEVHLHHDNDTEAEFTDRVSRFIHRLHDAHGLLRKDQGRIRFGFIHGNWALDNSLPDGRFCGLNNEITLLNQLGCYADFTLPSAPSPAQTRMVNTIYWATDDPARPKSHDTGVPVTVGGEVAGDLMMIPGPLTVNLREWALPHVPKIECGELAGNCLPTQHRVRLWLRVAPRIGGDAFIKLFAHGAPEKNAIPLLDEGALDRTFEYLNFEARESGAEVFFVTAYEMWAAVDALRRGVDPTREVQEMRGDSSVNRAYAS